MLTKEKVGYKFYVMIAFYKVLRTLLEVMIKVFSMTI